MTTTWEGALSSWTRGLGGNCKRVSSVGRSRNDESHAGAGWLVLSFTLFTWADDSPPARARAPPPPSFDKRHREAGRGILTGMRGRVVCKEWLNGGCHTRLKACRCQCQHHAILLPTEILRKVLLKLLWG